MASKSCSLFSASLFLSINLLFFALVSGTNINCPPKLPNPSTNPKPLFPSPSSSSSTPATKSCPRDALKLGICAKVLNGPVNAVIGTPPVAHCCTLLDGLIDLEAAVCLCTAIKANILGLNLNIPIALSLLVNICGKEVPSGFQCA